MTGKEIRFWKRGSFPLVSVNDPRTGPSGSPTTFMDTFTMSYTHGNRRLARDAFSPAPRP
jgi:hypothetical protein